MFIGYRSFFVIGYVSCYYQYQPSYAYQCQLSSDGPTSRALIGFLGGSCSAVQNHKDQKALTRQSREVRSNKLVIYPWKIGTSMDLNSTFNLLVICYLSTVISNK
jgi:hypothetical protein